MEIEIRHMEREIRHMSDLPFHMTDLYFHMSDLPFHMSDLPFHMSDLPFHMTDLYFHMCDLPFHMTDLPGRKKCVNDVPSSFVSNGKILSGEVEIAEGFNDFFVNIGPKLSKSIPIATKNLNEYMTAPCSENFVFANITPDIVNDALKKLN